MRGAIQEICNIKLDNLMWSQASLPTSMGGLGIRRAADLALPAFLSSTHATQEVVFSVLPEGESVKDSLQAEAIDMWRERSGIEIPPDHCRGSQRVWDQGLTEKAHTNLLQASTDPVTTARLHATATKESGAWLNALPIPHLGTKLDSYLSPSAYVWDQTSLRNIGVCVVPT